ncbi:MAG: Mur ligase family protein [Planctomycetota bacterium]
MTNQLPASATLQATGEYERSLQFLYNRLNYERQVRGAEDYPFRLQRFIKLLQELDLGHFLHEPGVDPSVPLIHIAGTKGKGSTATMVSSVLTDAGYRTGLYSSPHLHDLEERFRIDGLPCTPKQLVDLVDSLRAPTTQIEQADGALSFFELTTALALLHFQRQHCDVVVVEVGLGGRLDSTNVCAPSVTAITSIGLDHQHVLGHTLEKIAAEKAGIIKSPVPVVSGATQPEVNAVIRDKANTVGAPFYCLGNHFDVDYQPASDWGSSAVFRGHRAPLARERRIQLSMEGAHQAKNAAIAAVLIDLLRDRTLVRGKPFQISESAIERGLANCHCIGRTERWLLNDNRMAIVDSAHNDDSIEALCDTLRQRCADRPIVTVFGTSTDKTVEPMLNRLAEVSTRLVLTRFLGNPRYRDPEQLRPLVSESIRNQTEVVEDPLRACEIALSSTPPGGTLVVCGSFFLAAECRHWIAQQSKRA